MRRVLGNSVSKIGQTARYKLAILRRMESTVRILKLQKDGDDGLIVTFSDGTLGAYVVEELLGLRPHRELVVDRTIPINRKMNRN
jgi:hypothetical protein